TYQPKAHGSSSGTVTLADATASTSTSFTVSGTSTTPGQLTVSPSSISFGSVIVGQTQRQSATVSNTGGSDITITQASVSGTGFSLIGLALPLTLHPSDTAPFAISFTPASGGSSQWQWIRCQRSDATLHTGSRPEPGHIDHFCTDQRRLSQR